MTVSLQNKFSTCRECSGTQGILRSHRDRGDLAASSRSFGQISVKETSGAAGPEFFHFAQICMLPELTDL